MASMTAYRHTQIGWAIIVPLAAIAVLVLLVGGPSPAAALLVVGALACALFGSLTVTVDDRALAFRFGVGIVRRRIPLESIQSWQEVRNPWWYGWGIRFYPHGMLFNVSGLSAIELLLADGRRLRVGTDQPDAVAQALARRRGAPPAFDVALLHAPARPPGRWFWALVACSVLVLVVVVSSLARERRPPVVIVSDDTVSVSGTFGTTVPLASITAVSLEDTLPRIGLRTNGFALGQTLRGQFRLEGIGRARLFVERDRPPYVQLRTIDGVMYVNFDDVSRTRALYEELTRALARVHPVESGN